jgi:creatinine amidohydrolase
MPYNARPYVLHEASLGQLMKDRPNCPVLVWGATEGHNYHLPHGTDVTEGTLMAEAVVQRANAKGAKCILLPTVPFGNDNLQVDQVCTITMRSSTQQAVLHDICDSLVRQGFDRLVLLNFHGGNEFKQMIRDIMFDLPIFIVQIHGYLTAPFRHLLEDPTGDHADEFETSLMLHLTPDWVDLSSAGNGKATPFKLASFKNPAVWAPRNWAALTKDTGVGDPRAATAEKGRQIFELLVDATVPMLVELSKAKDGDFPFVVPRHQKPAK